MLEIHLDNPGLVRATDTSGLLVHYTGRLRRHDAGLLATGVATTPLHVVPPKQPFYKTAGYCSIDCTKQVGYIEWELNQDLDAQLGFLGA